MDRTSVTLLFIGWLVYWLSAGRLASKQTGFRARAFAEDNFWDMALSLLNCLIILISHDQFNFSLLDLSKPENVLIAGFTSTVVINHFIKQVSNT